MLLKVDQSENAHTYHICGDGRKRIKMKTNTENIAGTRVCSVRIEIHLRHNVQFYRSRTFQCGQQKTYQNGSLDANRSMRFRCLRKRILLKTHWCRHHLSGHYQLSMTAEAANLNVRTSYKLFISFSIFIIVDLAFKFNCNLSLLFMRVIFSYFAHYLA